MTCQLSLLSRIIFLTSRTFLVFECKLFVTVRFIKVLHLRIAEIQEQHRGPLTENVQAVDDDLHKQFSQMARTRLTKRKR